MTKREKKNLAFLLQGDTPVLRQWYREASQDDKEYAMELLMMHAGKKRKDEQGRVSWVH